MTSILHVIANVRVMLLRDGGPVLVIPVPTLAVATLLPVVVTLLAAG